MEGKVAAHGPRALAQTPFAVHTAVTCPRVLCRSMAIAPPHTRELDVLVLAESRAGVVDAMALLRYLQMVRPRVLVLMGEAWGAHLRDVDAFKDAILAEELERMIVRGTRVFVLDRRQRRSGTLALPGGREVPHRRELVLRVEGQWLRFGDWGAFHSRWARLGIWTRAWLVGAREPKSVAAAAARSVGTRLSAFAEAIGPRALAEAVDGIVCTGLERGLRTVSGEGADYCVVASPGDWHEEQHALEFRFGRWALRAAAPRRPLSGEAQFSGSQMRERFVYGRHPVS